MWGFLTKIDGEKGGFPMASNFQLFSHRNRNSVHLSLYGNFDGSSAHQLINSLKKISGDFKNICIDTNGLNKVYPFGLRVFEKQLKRVSKKIYNINFVGKHKNNFAN